MTGEKGTALISGDSGGVGGAAVTALPPLSAGLGLGMSTGPPDFFFFFFPAAGFAAAGDTMADKPYYPAGRAISRVQIELLATKVSSLNGCAY